MLTLWTLGTCKDTCGWSWFKWYSHCDDERKKSEKRQWKKECNKKKSKFFHLSILSLMWFINTQVTSGKWSLLPCSSSSSSSIHKQSNFIGTSTIMHYHIWHRFDTRILLVFHSFTFSHSLQECSFWRETTPSFMVDYAHTLHPNPLALQVRSVCTMCTIHDRRGSW